MHRGWGRDGKGLGLWYGVGWTQMAKGVGLKNGSKYAKGLELGKGWKGCRTLIRSWEDTSSQGISMGEGRGSTASCSQAAWRRNECERWYSAQS